MKEEIIFELGSVYRDPMRVKGYSFGQGEHAMCIVGATRGNEVQQVYIRPMEPNCREMVTTYCFMVLPPAAGPAPVFSASASF